MNTDRTRFEGKHSSLTSVILRAYYDVYSELGSGFLESVYHAAMESALRDAGLTVASQVQMPVYSPFLSTQSFNPEEIPQIQY